jgi:PhnB protein
MVKPIPDGFHTVTPYLLVDDGAKLIAFLEKGLGGKTMLNHKTPDGKVMHAQVKVGDSMIMLADAPKGHKAIASILYMYVPDTDAVFARATAAGAAPMQTPADQFYGDRTASLTDPCGNVWWIATHKEELSDAELQKRGAEAKKK